MKLWDDLLKLLFPSSIRTGIILFMALLALIYIPTVIFTALSWEVGVPPYVGVIYGAYLMFFGFALKSLDQRDLREQKKKALNEAFKSWRHTACASQ